MVFCRWMDKSSAFSGSVPWFPRHETYINWCWLYYIYIYYCIYICMYISRYVYIYICISSCANNDQLPLSDSLILTRTTVEFQNPSLLSWLTHLPFNWNSRVICVCPKIGYTTPKRQFNGNIITKILDFLEYHISNKPTYCPHIISNSY